MPKIEDLERLGSIAFLIGNKALPKEISQNDYDRFKSVFTDEHMANSMPAEDNGLMIVIKMLLIHKLRKSQIHLI